MHACTYCSTIKRWPIIDAMLSRRRRVLPIALIAILLFFSLAVGSMVDDSPTMDEQNHLARGLAFLASGDPRFSVEHPPLVNVLSAAPVYALQEVELPFDDPSWEHPEGWYAFADEMLWTRNREQVSQMIFLARVPIVFLTIGLALIGYRFARRLWGASSGLLVLLFLLLDPNLMAHGRYTTTDLGGTLFLVLAAYSLWRIWSARKLRWPDLGFAGLALGLALGSKMSNLAFMPVFAGLAVLPLYGRAWNWRKAARRLAKIGAASILGLLVLWAIFGFEWGPMRFVSAGWATFNKVSGPMPTYWAGVEQILAISAGGRPSFLMGQFSTQGFWYYFPVALAVKTPLPSLLAMVVAAVVLVRRRETWARAAYLLLPAVVYLLLSTRSALNIGYRHLLPMLPFLYVLAAGLVAGEVGLSAKLSRMARLLAIGTVVALLIVNLWIQPYYLSYFNIAAGGPANGYNVLVDSNVDWGQDLIRLSRWVEDTGAERLKLSWFGTADPTYYGIAYEPLPGLPRHFNLWWAPPFDPDKPEPGTYAISVSNLWELPLEEKTVFAWFRERPPDDRIGYSINIYEVSSDADPGR